MKQKLNHLTRAARSALATGGTAMLVSGAASAASLVDNDSYSVRLDTNVSYTIGARTTKPAAENVNNAFVNDGDAAFNRGDLITNRMDLSVEFDAMLKDKYKTGIRVSGLAFYDQVYQGSHVAIPQDTYNQTSVSNTQFTKVAKRKAGDDVQVFDLFVHGGTDIGDHSLTFRLGRHTLLWGESLYLSTNGIAYGQAPINANKALSVPLIAAKEVFLPVNQLSATLSLNEHWQLQGYYQLEYRETQVSPPGTYWNTADFVFQGAENIVIPGVATFPRGDDVRPRAAKGQYGLAAKFSDPDSAWDAGLYYLRFNDKTPQIYLDGSNPAAPPSFRFVYPTGIQMIGASASTTVGDANVAGEISYRTNMPLFGGNYAFGFPFAPTGITRGMADSDALTPKGRTLHAQVSTIWVLPTVSLWDTASFVAEIGAHRVLKVTDNEANIDPTRSRSMVGAVIALTPTYYQLVAGADVSFPVSVAYNFVGKRSLVDGSFNSGVGGHGGKLGLGVNVKYTESWRAALNYTHYTGSVVQNQYRDRDFLALNINYSF